MAPATIASFKLGPTQRTRPKDSAVTNNNDSGYDSQTDFERAQQEKPLSMIGEFWLFIRENKKWWLIPVLIAFLLLGLLAILGSTGAAPFIYTLF
jgi:hypothetical protein